MRILLADGFVPWRRFVSSLLQKKPSWLVVAEASDGLEAVQKALQLKPDLILLGISLPKLSGIEAARLIRELTPNSKIIFASTHEDWAYVQEALNAGADGYILKACLPSELVQAVDAVFQGKRFLSGRITGMVPADAAGSQGLAGMGGGEVSAPTLARPGKIETVRCHELQFYSDDGHVVERFACFIEAALKAENSAVVAATEPHREGILRILQSRGLNIDAAIDQGRFISIGVAETLARFMVNGQLDRDQFFKIADKCIASAVKAANGAPRRVAACGECAPMLLAMGKAEEAILLEHLWNELARNYEIDILCGYPVGSFNGTEGGPIFRRLCAEHSEFSSQ